LTDLKLCANVYSQARLLTASWLLDKMKVEAVSQMFVVL